MDKKWVTIAAIVGIVAVVAIALVFFLGGGNNPGTSPGQLTPTPSGTQTQVSGTGTTSPTIRQPTPVVIPVTGLFVNVSYLGAFNGTYGINGAMQKVRSSGNRLYTIDNTTGNVIATFSKEDRSSHALMVEIWKNGRLLTSAVNSTAFGKVSISYTV
jgi:hypothetical protein